MTRTHLLCLLVLVSLVGCAPEVAYDLSNEGDQQIYVQGPENTDMPWTQVLVDGEYEGASREPKLQCIRACGAATTECVDSEAFDDVGYALPPGTTWEYARGPVWYRTEDTLGVCLKRLTAPTTVRVRACWSTEAIDFAGDSLELDQAGPIHADWGPLELVDPTCEDFEFDSETVGQVVLGAPTT